MLKPSDRKRYMALKEPVNYRVIADFPNNKDFPVGETITLQPWQGIDWIYVKSDCQGVRTYLASYLDKFPYLFQKKVEEQKQKEANNG